MLRSCFAGCLAICLSFPVIAAEPVRVFRGARVLPIAGPPIDDGTVVVRGATIEAVGPTDRARIPPGAEVIDLGVVEGLDVQSHFLDGIHLNPDGRAVFSPVFGRSVAEVLSAP